MTSTICKLGWTFVVLVSILTRGVMAQEASGDRVERILTDLERRSDGLRDIRCGVRYVEDDRINLTKRTKTGSILFQIVELNPRFFIQFDKTVTDEILGKREWYLFDGRWLSEAVERVKQVTRREIVRPGEKIDLFDLETAPFPLPFGQKKETILRNFEVQLVAPTDGDPKNADHLVCIPKPESPLYGEYDQLDFFVHKEIHLPIRIVVTRNKGLEINTADFPDLSEKSINTGVTRKDFTAPSAWKKYKVVVEELAPVGESVP